ncbi:MAG: fused MFS/spermidine synthase [Flavobacteriales bacterium]|nr:fused MFS/spermidine synthase [Flavobacteriales bacterium]
MPGDSLKRWLSWLYPMPVETVEGKHGTLSIRWEYGRKVLNSTEANQSFGSLHSVWQEAFRQARIADAPPDDVLLLGLGAGSVPHILRHELRLDAPITAVELDPVVVDIAQRHFALDEIEGLGIVLGDATVQVHALPERFGLVVVDLFDDLDLARGVDTAGFAHALRARCAIGGIVLFNTVGYDDASATRCGRVLDHLRQVFGEVEELRLEEVNRVFIAR